MDLFNKAIATVLPIVPKSIVQKVSERYIAGATLDDAVRTVKSLNAKGAMATVDVLGEFIQDLDQAARNTAYCCEVLRRIHHDGLKGNLSIKLTSLGLELDLIVCEQNVRTILDAARENGHNFVRIDMENSPFTTMTIGLYKKLRREYDNVGIVLQSYLRRTIVDIEDLLEEGNANNVRTNVRLCKGIYIEPETIAFKERRDVQASYLACLDTLFEGNAYIGIATHDDVLIAGAKERIRKRNLKPDQYEFQMLLGVRDAVRDALIREGYRIRIYVPFGEDWYGYSIRRLKENPKMGGYIVKALLTGK
ncbi:MAG TPA: proline dehydrogenase family protein [Candidatus Kapabacteria bacterium]|nr:proline dehydrogenase family protein [Candidatus Kapabacteria bacterium]